LDEAGAWARAVVERHANAPARIEDRRTVVIGLYLPRYPATAAQP
jgi:hypothetical protein